MLTVLIPTRGRPHRVRPILNAWYATSAFDDGARLVFLTDADDPNLWTYRDEIRRDGRYGSEVFDSLETSWLPMVKKLDRAAKAHADLGAGMIAFMGDDHLPRTEHWAARVMEELADDPSVISSPDGYRVDDLPTWWAMSGSIVSALGRMVPAPVEHLYCDNSVRDLAAAAGIYRWLPDVLIEHMHPAAGKADPDDGYARVNSLDQYASDRDKYAVWRHSGLRRDTALVNLLKGAHRGA